MRKRLYLTFMGILITTSILLLHVSILTIITLITRSDGIVMLYCGIITPILGVIPLASCPPRRSKKPLYRFEQGHCAYQHIMFLSFIFIAIFFIFLSGYLYIGSIAYNINPYDRNIMDDYQYQTMILTNNTYIDTKYIGVYIQEYHHGSEGTSIYYWYIVPFFNGSTITGWLYQWSNHEIFPFTSKISMIHREDWNDNLHKAMNDSCSKIHCPDDMSKSLFMSINRNISIYLPMIHIGGWTSLIFISIAYLTIFLSLIRSYIMYRVN